MKKGKKKMKGVCSVWSQPIAGIFLSIVRDYFEIEFCVNFSTMSYARYFHESFISAPLLTPPPDPEDIESM